MSSIPEVYKSTHRADTCGQKQKPTGGASVHQPWGLTEEHAATPGKFFHTSRVEPHPATTIILGYIMYQNKPGCLSHCPLQPVFREKDTTINSYQVQRRHWSVHHQPQRRRVYFVQSPFYSMRVVVKDRSERSTRYDEYKNRAVNVRYNRDAATHRSVSLSSFRARRASDIVNNPHRLPPERLGALKNRTVISLLPRLCNLLKSCCRRRNQVGTTRSIEHAVRVTTTLDASRQVRECLAKDLPAQRAMCLGTTQGPQGRKKLHTPNVTFDTRPVHCPRTNC